jgi:tetratricopeptide (TPR) repeat protein
MTFRLSFLSLLLVLLLGGCQRPAAEDQDFYDIVSTLPGVRLSLSQPPSPVFKQVGLDRVTLVHENGGDIWLLAPDDALDRLDNSGEFRAWLKENSPVSFHVGDTPVYYIPGGQRNVFDIVLSHKLDDWADAKSMARLWAQQGESLMESGRTQAAIDAYQKALALDGSQMDANVGMGQVLLKENNLDAAIDAFNTALLSDPWNVQALKGLGQAYFYQHRYDLAVDPLTRAYLLQPDDPKVLLPVALGLAAQGQKQEALKVLDVAASLVSDGATKSDINTIREEIISDQK